MRSIEYLKSQIDYLVDQFPEMKCIYRFDTSDDSHIIDIYPRSTYQSSSQFNDKCMRIDLAFIAKYPTECLFFVDSNEIGKNCPVIYEKAGALFASNCMHKVWVSEALLREQGTWLVAVGKAFGQLPGIPHMKQKSIRDIVYLPNYFELVEQLNPNKSLTIKFDSITSEPTEFLTFENCI